MDLKRKDFTPKKEDKHQSSKKRVSKSKFRSLICRAFFTYFWRIFKFLLNIFHFQWFYRFLLLFYLFGKSTWFIITVTTIVNGEWIIIIEPLIYFERSSIKRAFSNHIIIFVGNLQGSYQSLYPHLFLP